MWKSTVGFIVRVREGTVLFNFASLVFLALSRHSPQAASALETLLGCEQREPEKLSEMLAHLLSLPGILIFDLSGCGESSRHHEV